MEYTAKLMEQYALLLINKIQEQNNLIVKAEDYFYIVDNLLSALSEFSNAFTVSSYTKEDKKRYFITLLQHARYAVLNNVKEFNKIKIDFDSIIII